MARPKTCRHIRFKPKAHYFKPQGLSIKVSDEVILTREEMEAIKLKDYDGFDQIDSAEAMKTSQSTFQRILASARAKIAQAIVKGKALKIEK